jgi:hypothetical protein
MKFPIGVHTGEVRAEAERLHGDAVNVAARLQALAEPGGICVSAAVHEQVGRKVAVAYPDLGEQSLKNIAEPVRPMPDDLFELDRDTLRPQRARHRERRLPRRAFAALDHAPPDRSAALPVRGGVPGYRCPDPDRPFTRTPS